ncbi:MAG: PAS domain-containing sensor histidine kinase [Taibaiella sp.]|nr:PAS domain-containing sensor histidine kinase [Taibaiella sp.]
MPFTNLTNDTFEALFNYASIGILIADAAGEIQMANKFIEQQFGYAQDQLVGNKVEILIPARYTSKHEKHRESFAHNPHSRPMGLGMELSGLKKDGTEFPVEVSLGHYKVEGATYSLAFISDITQRKETEQAVINLNAHLEEKVKEGTQSLAITVEQLSSQIKETERKDLELERVNTFLNNIWNHAGAIIFVCDKEGLVQFFNPEAEKALGYSSAEVVNKLNIISIHLPQEISEKSKELTIAAGRHVESGFEVLIKASQANNNNNLEWHYVRKDGSFFYVSLNVAALKDPANEISGYLGIAIDISEKKRAESELLIALKKERELNELKSRFVSMASHEFRTPLSAVSSSAFLLSKYLKAEEQPQRNKHIKRIVSCVTSLTEILNDFLSVGKIEEGNIEPNFIQYDISKQMQEITHDVHHLLKMQQSISYTHTGADALVNLDPSMMKHVVTNLLSNAVKFSSDEAVIELKTERIGKSLVLQVKDHGLGIPSEDIENLYKRFFRSSNVTNIQGTGLGLHIVSKYTELMNGTITCQSTLGEGTTFTIIFTTN